MKLRMLLGAACLLFPSMALAQIDEDGSQFSGVKVGAALDYRRLKGDYRVPSLSADIDRSRSGFAYRGFVGVDKAVGALVVGGEAGVGRGGNALKMRNGAGEYALKPNWTWDTSVRLGVTPTRNMLIYGRVGYSWLRLKETTAFVANRNDLVRRDTDGGYLYGLGVETALTNNMFLRTEYARANYGNGLSSSRFQLGVSVGF